MDKVIDGVTLRCDSHGGKLERLYSIRRVMVLHGVDVIAGWQARAAVYPDALAARLVADMHLHRGDLLLFYQTLAAAEFHLMGVLLALNRVYRPELKRLRDLCDELALKPDDLAARLNAILRDDPRQAARDFDTLAEEVFALVERHMLGVDATAARAAFHTRRRPVTNDPTAAAPQIE